MRIVWICSFIVLNIIRNNLHRRQSRNRVLYGVGTSTNIESALPVTPFAKIDWACGVFSYVCDAQVFTSNGKGSCLWPFHLLKRLFGRSLFESGLWLVGFCDLRKQIVSRCARESCVRSGRSGFKCDWSKQTLSKEKLLEGRVHKTLRVWLELVIWDCCELMWISSGDFDQRLELLGVEVVVIVIITFAVLQRFRGFCFNGLGAL